jgi:hypothetical protein
MMPIPKELLQLTASRNFGCERNRSLERRPGIAEAIHTARFFWAPQRPKRCSKSRDVRLGAFEQQDLVEGVYRHFLILGGRWRRHLLTRWCVLDPAETCPIMDRLVVTEGAEKRTNHESSDNKGTCLLLRQVILVGLVCVVLLICGA